MIGVDVKIKHTTILTLVTINCEIEEICCYSIYIIVIDIYCPYCNFKSLLLTLIITIATYVIIIFVSAWLGNIWFWKPSYKKTGNKLREHFRKPPPSAINSLIMRHSIRKLILK